MVIFHTLFFQLDFCSLITLGSILNKFRYSICNAGDLGSISALGRFPGGRHDNPVQYSCLENSMDRGACYNLWGPERVRHYFVTTNNKFTITSVLEVSRWLLMETANKEISKLGYTDRKLREVQ